jgi:cysteinyl-tRNA synthetase
MDLIFPHHENEVAQSESVYGPPMAKYWLHGGFLEIDKEKMAKSLGNFVTIRDVLERNDAEAFRYYLLGTHYRGPLSFDVEKTAGRVSFPPVDEAERRVDYLYYTYAALKAAAGSEAPAKTKLDDMPEKVLAALDNDLNTPQALAVLADLAKAANDISKQKNKKAEAAAAAIALEKATAPLGLMQSSPEAYMKRTQERRIKVRGLVPAEIDAKLADRQSARAAKDFARADAIRKELLEKGIEVLDSATGSSWRVTQ